jgi:hypothetical protein
MSNFENLGESFENTRANDVCDDNDLIFDFSLIFL